MIIWIQLSRHLAILIYLIESCLSGESIFETREVK